MTTNRGVSARSIERDADQPVVSEQAVLDTLSRGAGFLESVQWEEGCVAGEVVWCPMLTAQYIMTAYMTGQEIPEERKARFLKYFRVWQIEDGGWGLHAESHSYVFVTALVYVALRLMGRPADDPMCRKGLEWLKSQGGVLAIPSWGKAWLSMIRLYDWSGVAAIVPELWLQPDSSPFHPRRMYCHTRLIYLGLSYLYGVKYQAPITDLILQLREELYDEPFEAIDFSAHRYDLCENDVYEYPHPILKAGYEALRAYDRLAPDVLRRKALDRCLDHIVFHQRQSRYAAISPVNGLLNVLALHHAGHPDFLPTFEGVDYWAWCDEEEGERFNGAHSHSWDTAFAAQAFGEGELEDDAALDFMKRAARYLKGAQQHEEIPERDVYYRDRRRGGWCFSNHHHRWPVSDCTAEALSGLRYLADRVDERYLPGRELLAEAARFILTRQNPDGGWGSYERRRGGMFLEKLNPSEMFGNCMVEHSYVECTASCMQGLRHFLDRFGDLVSGRERRRIEKSIARGERFLRKAQLEEGAWEGFWGVNYTYGTLFGVIGLLAAGADRKDPAVVRACRWVVDARLEDGGWGESYMGLVEQRYVPHERSQVIMTSWALMTLLKASYDGPGAEDAIDSGVKLLVDRQLPDGDWPKEGVGGTFFNTAMHHYCLYKNVFPIWALGLHKTRR